MPAFCMASKHKARDDARYFETKQKEPISKGNLETVAQLLEVNDTTALLRHINGLDEKRLLSLKRIVRSCRGGHLPIHNAAEALAKKIFPGIDMQPLRSEPVAAAYIRSGYAFGLLRK